MLLITTRACVVLNAALWWPTPSATSPMLWWYVLLDPLQSTNSALLVAGMFSAPSLKQIQKLRPPISGEMYECTGRIAPMLDDGSRVFSSMVLPSKTSTSLRPVRFTIR